MILLVRVGFVSPVSRPVGSGKGGVLRQGTHVLLGARRFVRRGKARHTDSTRLTCVLLVAAAFALLRDAITLAGGCTC